ncbi:MAG: prolyl oligopeptidase family serine peptidase [Acidobacteriota bacterium]
MLTYAGKLEHPLLIVHGMTDDNVYFVHALKLSQALFRAGKPFELLPLPGTHMVPDPEQNMRLWARTIEHFKKAFAPTTP